MSTTVDNRVVEMQFDNKQFERNVSTTLSSLDKLKQRLNLSGAAKGLENVGTAAKGINLSGLTGAAETVGLKFNAMWTIADQALRNITNSAINAGKRVASAFTIDPIKTGFAEYETQINAVQTILANTKSKGTTIDNVNTALDELNTYADKTIYNFTEMTRNIGTFTAAGVDLDKSVTSIKGIANLAAVSGSSSQQASTAMYQLSQALSAGTVRLMDWNSVVNAGMGGEVFQNALKRTAQNMGTNVDALIEKYGSFRESLTQGEWLTADVLTETLTQLSGAYTEADLLAKGYTQEQAAEILDLAQTAEDAATKVKTFTQLWDTLKESAQSGWTQTWEILIGDFEEAKETLTNVSNVIGKMIGDSAQARNELLGLWKQVGGRSDLIKGIANAFDGVMNIINPIKEAFRNIFPPITLSQLVIFTNNFKHLMASFKEFTASHGDQIRTTFEGIFSIVDIGWTLVKKLGSGLIELFSHFTGLGGSILDTTAGIGEWLTGLRDTVKETDIFGNAIDEVIAILGKINDKLKSFGNSVKEAFQAPGVQGFLGVMTGIWNVISAIGSRVGEIFAPLGQAISNVFNNVSFSDILNDGIFAGVLVGIYKFVDNLNGPLTSIKDMFNGLAGEDGIIGGIKNALDSVRGCFEAYQNSLQAETIKKIASAIAILAAAILVISSIDGAALDQALGSITVLFAELMGSLAVFSKLDFGGKGLMKGASSMAGLASALLILSGAMKIMSTMSWNEIAVGIVGTVAGLGALVAAVNLLPEKNVTKSAKAIGKLATALVILAAGMKIMASMSWQELGAAITGVVAGLGVLVAAVNLLPKDAGLRSAGMIGLATAMVVLGGAMKLMGSMSWTEIAHGLAAMAGSLIAIVGAMNLMPKDAAVRSLGMVGLATAMVILGAALKNMGGMSWEEIGRGLVAMGGALAELSIALMLMNGTLAGSAALIIAAGALAIIAPVMKSLGGLSWEGIGKGLVALAGAFAVIGVAGLLLTPLIPTLLGLAGAMALFGVATLAIGAGVAAVAFGFTALATAGATGATAFVAALSAIVIGLIDLTPTIVAHLGDMITAFCDVIISVAPKLADTLLVVISEVLASLAQYTPQIVDSLLQFLMGVMDALAANMPQLVASAVVLISSVMRSIADSLAPLIEGVLGPALTILSDLVTAIVAVISEALTALADMFDTVFNGIATVVTSFGEVLTGLSDVFDSVFGGIASVVTSVGDSIKGVLDGIAGIIESIGTAALDAGTGFENLANGVATITGLKLADMAASLAAVAVGIGDIAAHSADIEGVADAMGLLPEAAASVVDGFESVSAAAATMLKSMIATMRNAYSSFQSTGAYLVMGFANGITANTYIAAARAKAMAKAAATAARAELDEHSPSRVGYEIGDFFGIAFVNAIGDNVKRAYDASAEMANSAKTGLKNAFDKVSSIINGEVDVNPTIKPVLDLTDVRSGANAISGMLGLQPSVGVLAHVGAVNSMMNQRGQTASNDDVVYAINKLQKALGNVGNTSYHIDGVTYDDGSNIADAVRTITRAAVRERRV